MNWAGAERYAPVRHHAGDAGMDLVNAESGVVGPGTFKDIRCGIKIALPEGVWAMLTGRSSTLRKRGLQVQQGIIDNGYRGELYFGVWNLTEEAIAFNDGERLAQLIPFPLMIGNATLRAKQFVPVRVAERSLGETSRGGGGFGSTGL